MFTEMVPNHVLLRVCEQAATGRVNVGCSTAAPQDE